MKDEILSKYGCVEVSAIEMYSDIFRLGEGLIQHKNEPGGVFKTNPIAIAHNGSFGEHIIMFEDEFEKRLNDLPRYSWAYMEQNAGTGSFSYPGLVVSRSNVVRTT